MRKEILFFFPKITEFDLIFTLKKYETFPVVIPQKQRNLILNCVHIFTDYETTKKKNTTKPKKKLLEQKKIIYKKKFAVILGKFIIKNIYIIHI